VSLSRFRAAWPRALAVICLSAALLISAGLGWLKWHENELVFQAARSHWRIDGALPASATPLELFLKDGSTLAALLMQPRTAGDAELWVLHLHGNAASAFDRGQLRHCEQLSAVGFHVLCFDYRGFGRSSGVASETHMNEDAEAAYEALIARGVSSSQIIIWGHSLGSAPAIELAVRHPDSAALVLFGAFTSIDDMAAATYPYLPVRWVVGIHMPSLQRIGSVRISIVIAHSVHDAVVPFQQAQRLYAAAHEPKRFLTLDAPITDRLGGHVDALYDVLPSFAPQLRSLVDSAAAGPSRTQ